MTLHAYMDLEQRSVEWLELRRGLVTASVVGQLVTTKQRTAVNFDCPSCDALSNGPCRSRRTGEPILSIHAERTAVAKSDQSPPVLTAADNETTKGLAAFLAAERIAGIDPDGTYVTHDMFRGVIGEAPAREKYAEHYAVKVTECGFMVHEGPSYSIGYSPDGLVGDDGLIEIKSPRQKGHLLNAVGGTVPTEHMAQIQAGLLVSGRSWCDFVSYSGGMRLWVKRVLPDLDWFHAIHAAVAALEVEINRLVVAYHEAVDGFPMTERLDLDLEVTA